MVPTKPLLHVHPAYTLHPASVELRAQFAWAVLGHATGRQLPLKYGACVVAVMFPLVPALHEQPKNTFGPDEYGAGHATAVHVDV